jgi:hypothetical protein
MFIRPQPDIDPIVANKLYLRMFRVFYDLYYEIEESGQGWSVFKREKKIYYIKLCWIGVSSVLI